MHSAPQVAALDGACADFNAILYNLECDAYSGPAPPETPFSL